MQYSQFSFFLEGLWEKTHPYSPPAAAFISEAEAWLVLGEALGPPVLTYSFQGGTRTHLPTE